MLPSRMTWLRWAAVLLAAAGAAGARAADPIPTALVKPLTGGMVSFQILASYPLGNPYTNYHVHAFGIPSAHVVSTTYEGAGVLLPGIPADVRLFNAANGSFVTVKAGDPPVQVTGALVFPDEFMTFNCNDTVFAAGSSGATTPMASYYHSTSGSTYYQSITFSPVGQVRLASGSNTYTNARNPRQAGLQVRSGTFMNSHSDNALPASSSCTVDVTHYVGF